MKAHESIAGMGRSLGLGASGELFFFDSAAPNGAGCVAGRAAPIVLVHGLGDEADSFRHLIPGLARGRRVLAPDLPGFGRSVAKRRVNLGFCLDALIGLLEAETPDGAILAGSSLGAVVCELAAIRRPGLVKGLVFMDGGFPTPASTGSSLLSTLIPFVGEKSYRSLRGKPDIAYGTLHPYYADLDALPGTDRAFLAERVVERVESESQMRAYFSLFRSLAFAAIFRQKSFARDLAALDKPLLLLWGSEDRVVPASGLDLLAATAKGASTALIEGAGHLPHQERPEACLEAMEKFLASI
jgi:pimeloyl-ACP methyl ester carboxylesterase